MKKILLHEEDAMHHRYKANLHCHTICSDGNKTAEQIKADYLAHGYSVIAYTDHNIILNHNDLTDASFLALNGMELNVNEEREECPPRRKKTCHLCLIAETPDNFNNVCYHRSKYLQRNAPNYRAVQIFDENAPDYERVYSADGVNDMIRRGKEGGFYVTYNHPTWSGETYPEYTSYHGMDAMEMFNYGCRCEGYEEWNGRVYDEMLNAGNRIFCIAADDNHNKAADGEPASDSYGGYVMIDAPALTYRDIIASLKAGNFYAVSGDTFTEGPKIREVFYEDGKITVKTDTAVRISILCGQRGNRTIMAKPGEVLQEVSFPLKNTAIWFRIVIADEKGNKACTNAFFLEDLPETQQ